MSTMTALEGRVHMSNHGCECSGDCGATRSDGQAMHPIDQECTDADARSRRMAPGVHLLLCRWCWKGTRKRS